MVLRQVQPLVQQQDQHLVLQLVLLLHLPQVLLRVPLLVLARVQQRGLLQGLHLDRRKVPLQGLHPVPLQGLHPAPLQARPLDLPQGLPLVRLRGPQMDPHHLPLHLILLLILHRAACIQVRSQQQAPRPVRQQGLQQDPLVARRLVQPVRLQLVQQLVRPPVQPPDPAQAQLQVPPLVRLEVLVPDLL